MGESKSRIIAVSAPTGFGKSPAYVAHAILSGEPTCIVTNSRGLQDQLMRDFKEIGMVDIRGRSNYQCEAREDYTCQEGHATRCPYKGTVGCPSSKAEMQANSSSLVVTNYDKWITSRRFGQGLTHFTQVIFDEGHDAPDAVAKAMLIEITNQDITKTLEVDYPLHSDNLGSWKLWAGYALPYALSLLAEQKEKIASLANPKPSWVKALRHMSLLCKRLSVLNSCRPEEWVVDEVEQGFNFNPIRPARYAEAVLFCKTPKIVIVSATLRPKTLYMLGVGRTQADYLEFESDFDVARCPIYYIPTMRVDFRNKDLSNLWVRMDQVISPRRDRKGIIHTVSYQRQQDILRSSRHAHFMLSNARGTPATSTVEVFKSMAPGSILVSPSLSTGYDFPGRDCEWQIMCKIPFPDGRSKINKARELDDPEYGPYQAMQTLVQAFGRGMRSKEDQCESFIFDDHVSWFVPRYRHLAPSSFHRQFKRVETLPQPPKRLP